MKTFIAAMALCVVALSAQAGELVKYKNWDDSPQGYFMTASERAEWKAVRTDEAAEEFVKNFVARRGGDAFVAEVAKRTEMADKYLTFGKNKGSQSLRGKLVILLGAPANIAVSNTTIKSGGSNGLDSTVSNNVGTGGAGIDGGGGSDPNAIGREGSSRTLKIYTFTFTGKTNPALGQDVYVPVVEVNAGSGKDRLKDGRKQGELQEIFERVAQASIKK